MSVSQDSSLSGAELAELIKKIQNVDSLALKRLERKDRLQLGDAIKSLRDKLDTPELKIARLTAEMNSIDETESRQLDDVLIQRLIEASTGLRCKLQRPWDVLRRIVWDQPAEEVSLTTMVRLKLFERWVEAKGGKKNPEELAKMVNYEDPDVLGRLLFMLSRSSLIKSPMAGYYELNEFSTAMADPGFFETLRYHWEIGAPVANRFPAVIEAQVSRNALYDPDRTIFGNCLGTDLSIFEYFDQNGLAHSFGRCMTAYAAKVTSWTEFYPTETLLKDHEPGQCILVDIGASRGHDIMKFLQKHCLVDPSCLVMQDLPSVIESVDKDIVTVHAMAHDFMTPQPIKNAGAYYLHTVCHDWSDKEVQEILRNITPAMQKGKSKILLHEIILTPNASIHQAAIDVTMIMLTKGGRERTIEEWKKIAESVGLHIVKVYPSNSTQSIIDLELK